MRILLRLKHWMIFLFISIFFVLDGDSIPVTLFRCGSFSIYITWMYLIGVICSKLSRNFMQLNMKLPGICYISLLILFILSNTNLPKMMENLIPSGLNTTLTIAFGLWFAFNLFYLFCFSSKPLMSVIEGKESSSNQYFGYFISFMYPPIGVWYIQPKVNKLLYD
jgi:hypothetical protein